jgi:hypothetical protein
MRSLATLSSPGAGDRAVLAAIMLALVVIAAAPAASDAVPNLSAPLQRCVAR